MLRAPTTRDLESRLESLASERDRRPIRDLAIGVIRCAYDPRRDSCRHEQLDAAFGVRRDPTRDERPAFDVHGLMGEQAAILRADRRAQPGELAAQIDR